MSEESGHDFSRKDGVPNSLAGKEWGTCGEWAGQGRRLARVAIAPEYALVSGAHGGRHSDPVAAFGLGAVESLVGGAHQLFHRCAVVGIG